MHVDARPLFSGKDGRTGPDNHGSDPLQRSEERFTDQSSHNNTASHDAQRWKGRREKARAAWFRDELTSRPKPPVPRVRLWGAATLTLRQYLV
ncbi:hypothetical protein BO71DRAFT_402722, partial [Aspergillus ellipticus CBS 707.79]